MGNFNIALPDPMRDWVEERVRSGNYADASSYILELIRHDQHRHDPLVAALIEVEKNGVSTRSIESIIGARSDAVYALSDEERADLEEAVAEVDRGELASDADVKAIFSRYKG